MPQKTTVHLDAKLQDYSNLAKYSYLMIIIWGPSKKERFYKKRMEIKERLILEFPKADVFFPEDKELNDKLLASFPASTNWDIVVRGDRFLELCDLCIALDMGDGAKSELARAITSPNVSKLRVFSPIKFKNSKSYLAVLRKVLVKFKTLKFFTQKEYDNCDIVGWAIDTTMSFGLSKIT